MRIINTSGMPLYLSYGTRLKGGITLEPNAQTTELPIETLHNKQLWKDVEAKKVQFKLGEGDHLFFKRVLEQDSRTVQVVAPKVQVKKPAPRPPVNVKPTLQTRSDLGKLGESKFGSPLSNAANRQAGIQQMNAMSEVAMGAPKSLKDIQRMNAAKK